MDGKPIKSCTTLAVMCEGHEIRTIEALEVDGRLDPGPAGLPRAARAAVRVLHAGDDDDRARPARREPEPQRAGDPHGDLRRDLPLHGLQEHRRRRPLGGRARGTPPDRRPEPWSTIEQNLPRPDAERPIGFGRLKRKEDERFIRGKGTYLDDIRLPGMVHGAMLRSPYAHAKIVSIDTSRGARAPERRRRRHGQGPRDARPGLDADDLLRHAGRAGRRQGPLPGPGGRVRDRHRRVLGPRRAAADRRRVRAAAGDRQRAQGARPRRPADPRRQGRPASTTWPARPGRPATATPPTAPSPRPTRSSSATSSTRAATRRRSRPAGSSPTSTRRPASSTSATATRRRTRTARSTRTSPAWPST